MKKELFISELQFLDKVLPLHYDDTFNYQHAFSIEGYKISVVENKKINLKLKSYVPFYCSGDKFIVVKESWLIAQSYRYVYKPSYRGKPNVYYIERRFQPDKLSKHCLKFLWYNCERFLILYSSKHGRAYMGRSYLINLMLRRIYEREKRFIEQTEEKRI